jgi:hypothetical protein
MPTKPYVGTRKAVDIEAGTIISGQITVATAGTEVQGPDVALTDGVIIKALPGNTKIGYVGNDATNHVSSSTGFPLSAGQTCIIQVANLNELWFDMETGGNGQGFAWIKG